VKDEEKEKVEGKQRKKEERKERRSAMISLSDFTGMLEHERQDLRIFLRAMKLLRWTSEWNLPEPWSITRLLSHFRTLPNTSPAFSNS
jgi:hypothetical protein